SRSSGINSVAELIAKSSRSPSKLNYATAGSGTLSHLAGETFSRRTSMNSVHVPFKGATPALTALIGGQIDWLFDSPAAVLPHVKSGALRVLAIAAPRRSPQLP